MNIQEYIVEHWKQKMSIEHPVLTIYDDKGLYYDLLPLAEESGIKVFDTTEHILHARLAASKYWSKTIGTDTDARMIIYRKCKMPANNRAWVEEPFVGFERGGVLFPVGPTDEYKNICLSFLPAKESEIQQLFAENNTSYNMINALLDGAAYPALEELTSEKSLVGITVGILAKNHCDDMGWLNDWQRFAELQFPGLDSTGITLKDIQQKLWAYILFSEFVFDLPCPLPDSLKTVAKAQDNYKETIYKICDNIRNSLNMRDTYVRMANKISEQLNLTDIFAKAKHLGDRVTFGFENSVEFNRFIEYVKKGEYTKAQDLYRKNQQDVWAQEEPEIKIFWQLAGYLLTLQTSINTGINTDGSLSEFVEWYASTGCDADNAYRRYLTEKNDAPALPAQVSELTELMITKYRDFTEREVKAYQIRIKQIKDTKDLKNQGCVEFVYPALNEGKKVAFIMVDALRYEMGKSFAQSIEKSFRERVECKPKVSTLPSITRFGMSNHLDDIEIKLVNKKLEPFIGDKVIDSPDDRIAYLKEKTCVDVQDVLLDDFDDSTIEDNTQLLVVRSFNIDKSGESIKKNGLSIMNVELTRLAKMLNTCKTKGFDLAVFVADHGFMLQNAFRQGDQINRPTGSDIVLEESRLIAGNLNDTPDTLSFIPADLGIKAAPMKLCYAKDYTVFKRGDVYYHEGLSPQENIVPIITVKLKEERVKKDFRIKLSYKEGKIDTVYTVRPVIDVKAFFDDLFGEDVNIKLVVTSDGGKDIGCAGGANYDEVTQLVHIGANVTGIRVPIEIDEEYRGSSITITALNAETKATLSVLKLNYENE